MEVITNNSNYEEWSPRLIDNCHDTTGELNVISGVIGRTPIFSSNAVAFEIEDDNIIGDSKQIFWDKLRIFYLRDSKSQEKENFSINDDLILNTNNEILKSLLITYTEIKKKNTSFWEGINLNNLDANVYSIMETLADLEPSEIDFELTSEKSIYYQLNFSNNLVFYLDHYLELQDKEEETANDDAEVVFQCFKEKSTISFFEGTIEKAILEISEKIIPIIDKKD